MIEGVQVVNKKWQYVYVNDSMVVHSKLTREELLGHTMMEKYPGIEETDIFAPILKSMTKRVPTQITTEFKFPDESKNWFSLRIEPIPQGILIMTYDVTLQKRAEEELFKMNELLENLVIERTLELRESLDRQKKLIKMKSSFISMASHELRTPLGIILTSANLAEKYTESSQQDKREKHFKRIKSSVRNLVETLNYFLTADKLGHGKVDTTKEQFDFDDYLKDLLKQFEEILKRGQKIKYSFKGDKEIVSDKKIIRNIIQNLVSNAIKYSKTDIELNIVVDPKIIKIEVIDHGIGIPKDQQGEMFEKFFRAKNTSNIQGTGLGLNIVKHYLDLLNGHISFTSEENIGTTFTVKLLNELTLEKERDKLYSSNKRN
ncbi:ATP-binding protein [Wenyingzhuangia sp. 1_MG-2023]|nr:ATP-binding protein [Wenyingzhuangia sp. 1_MG-2023]